MKRAFRTTCAGVVSIVFHTSAAKARYGVYLSATEVGYGISFKDIRVSRAPEFDSAAIQFVSGKCAFENHVARVCQEIAGVAA